MSLLKNIIQALPEVKAAMPLPVNYNRGLNLNNDARVIGNEVTLYASNDGLTHIEKGYKLNWVVYTCVKKITSLIGKIPFYVVDVKKTEQKSWNERKALLYQLRDPRAKAEAKRIFTKSIDNIILDSPLVKKLNRPNRNQTGSMFRMQGIGFKLLTGEMNQWSNRGVIDGQLATKGPPLEIFNVPKFALQLVGNMKDPWEIIRYQLSVPGNAPIPVPRENISMYIEQSFDFDNTLTQLRGQPPLEAALLQIQGLNEGAVRQIKQAVNGGANGLLYRQDAMKEPTPEQATTIRRQINTAVNGQDVHGTVAWLAGQWGYLPFGRSNQELQKVEIYDRDVDAICNVLEVPPGLLKSNQTYENAPTYYKQLIYGKVAPEAYGLRDVWNNSLIEMFDMDPERFQVDADILALPELAEDLKDQVAAVKDATWLTDNEKRIATGYEPLEDEAMNLTSTQRGEAIFNDNLDDEESELEQ